MKPLPLPLRLAAGVAVTTAERARDLPIKIVGLPVTVVSQALQLSMRVQQRVTELAIKGDDALASLRPVEDTPGWATFDEDTYADVDGLPEPGGLDEEARFDEDPRFGADAAGPPWRTANGHGSTAPHPLPEQRAGTALVAQPEDPWTLEERALAEDHEDGEFDSAPDTGPEHTGPEHPGPEAATPEPSESPEPAEPEAATPADAEPDTTSGPAGLTGYDTMTLPQLRARLRKLTLDQLEEIIAYERAHENRPSFLGMLTRRINNVRNQQ